MGAGAVEGAPASFLSQATRSRLPIVDKAAILQENMDHFILGMGLSEGPESKRNCATPQGRRFKAESPGKSVTFYLTPAK